MDIGFTTVVISAMITIKGKKKCTVGKMFFLFKQKQVTRDTN